MKTQIFGTFGPACATEETLRQMIDAGMTGMRLNLSHTALKDSEIYIQNYQSAAARTGAEPQILIDMQGPELRVGRLEDEVLLEEGEPVLLRAEDGGEINASQRSLAQEENVMKTIPVPVVVVRTAEVGDEILLDDGKLLVRVVEHIVKQMTEHEDMAETDSSYLVAKVIRGGKLLSHKSVKIVGKNMKLPPLTQHDIENIKIAKDYGVTALMQPFVLSGEDLREVRTALRAHGAEDIQIFAKIESRLGVEHIEDILPEADVIIIARGDLGNDMPLWELPGVQKKIENACKKANKPYIVVTQMLASMEANPVPTRAEVSDIYHAVYHGAWGVMVTGETAVGKYPIEAIRYLANTAAEAEKNNT